MITTTDLDLVGGFDFNVMHNVTVETTDKGVQFTYPDIHGSPYIMTRFRGDADPKYKGPFGSGGTLWRPVPRPDAPVVLMVEGTKQHLMVAHYADADVEVIGTQGCYGYMADGIDSDQLAVVAGRPVVIWFDADVTTNDRVHDAAVLLRDTLIGRGSDVTFIIEGAATAGADDLILRKPENERRSYLRNLIAAAGELKKMSDATRKKSRISRQKKQDAKSEKRVVQSRDYDMSNAFAEDNHHTVAYLRDQERWMVYEGGRWVHDSGATVLDQVSQYMNNDVLVRDDEGLPNPDYTGSAYHAGNVQKLVRGKHHVKVKSDVFDRAPLLLNTATNTIELDTQTDREHRAGDRLTRKLDVTYNPAAEAPEFHRFMSEALPDADVRGFVQRFVGMALLGEVRDHVFVMFTGTGANGKGTLVRILMALFGEYAKGIDKALITSTKFEGHKQNIASLWGSRLAVAEELGRDSAWNLESMKTLTGGDAMTGNFMRSNEFTFEPSHSLILTTNHTPKIAPGEKAFWRRYREVPFDVSFEGREDTTLDKRIIHEELSGVLNWALAGLREYLRDGLNAPKRVRVAVEDARADSDPLFRFVMRGDVFEVTGNASDYVQISDIRAAYVKWTTTNGGVESDVKDVTGFSKELRSSVSGLGTSKQRVGGKAVNVTTGIRYAGCSGETSNVPVDSGHRNALTCDVPVVPVVPVVSEFKRQTENTAEESCSAVTTNLETTGTRNTGTPGDVAPKCGACNGHERYGSNKHVSADSGQWACSIHGVTYLKLAA